VFWGVAIMVVFFDIPSISLGSSPQKFSVSNLSTQAENF
jgi:hypothetical protein